MSSHHPTNVIPHKKAKHMRPSTSRAALRHPGRSCAPGEARFARKWHGSCEDRAGHTRTANTAKSKRVENVLLRCSRRSSRRTSSIFGTRLLDPFVRDWCAFRAKGRQVCSESIRVIHQSHSFLGARFLVYIFSALTKLDIPPSVAPSTGCGACFKAYPSPFP